MRREGKNHKLFLKKNVLASDTTYELKLLIRRVLEVLGTAWLSVRSYWYGFRGHEDD